MAGLNDDSHCYAIQCLFPSFEDMASSCRAERYVAICLGELNGGEHN